VTGYQKKQKAGHPVRYKKYLNTQLQNTKHRIIRNGQMERQTDRHAHTKLFKWQIYTVKTKQTNMTIK